VSFPGVGPGRPGPGTRPGLQAGSPAAPPLTCGFALTAPSCSVPVPPERARGPGRRPFGLGPALCDSYYPAEWASGTPIEQPERIRGGVYALIEDPAGPIRRQIARSTDDLIARMPTHEEAVELDLPPGVPVVRVLRTVFDSADLPVEVQDSVMAADRHEFRYEEQTR
jgi:hypothetical protein